MQISNFRIGTRLGVAFGTMCVLIAVIAVAGAMSMRSLKNDIDTITTNRTRPDR